MTRIFSNLDQIQNPHLLENMLPAYNFSWKPHKHPIDILESSNFLQTFHSASYLSSSISQSSLMCFFSAERDLSYLWLCCKLCPKALVLKCCWLSDPIQSLLAVVQYHSRAADSANMSLISSQSIILEAARKRLSGWDLLFHLQVSLSFRCYSFWLEFKIDTVTCYCQFDLTTRRVLETLERTRLSRLLMLQIPQMSCTVFDTICIW